MGSWRVFARAAVVSALAAVALPAGATVASAAGGTHGYGQATPCPAVPSGYSTCLVRLAATSTSAGTTGSGAHAATPGASTPAGYSPTAITTAYGLPATGTGKTIALVDAFDDPTIAANLTTFSSQYGLPACTSGNGCFTKVNQTGGTTYPKATSGWDLEISLDVEWAHALAPKAHILLVEASTNSDTNLFTAVSYAAAHAQYVSMSWGGTEFSGETSFDAYFAAAPTDSFFASTGDSASAVLYPSASPYVNAVGGTTLTVTASTDTWKSESAWSTAGGGCSRDESATAAQKAFPTYDQAGATCAGKRAMPDFSLDANPNTGVAVYDTRKLSTGAVNWIQVGGTSASAVMSAALSASSGLHMTSAEVYGTSLPFYNVTSGSNGHPCEKGYNLCTGLGSWNKSVGTTNKPLSGSIGIAPGSQTLTAGLTSAPISVTLSSAAATGGVSVTLTTTSPTGRFSTATHSTSSNSISVRVPAGQTTSGAFTYEDTKAGTPTITAAASGWASASQTETVGPNSVATVTLSPASATLAVHGTQLFTAAGSDAYGNPVTSGFSAIWSTTVAGSSVSPSSGTSSTFTAGASAASGKVTATVGSVHASASVSVVAATQVGVSLSVGTATRIGASARVPITVATTGTSGSLSGATVKLSIYSGSCAGTLVGSASESSNSAGNASFTFTTSTNGSYCAAATATHSGYAQGSQTKTFTVTAAKIGGRGQVLAPNVTALR